MESYQWSNLFGLLSSYDTSILCVSAAATFCSLSFSPASHAFSISRQQTYYRYSFILCRCLGIICPPFLLQRGSARPHGFLRSAAPETRNHTVEEEYKNRGGCKRSGTRVIRVRDPVTCPWLYEVKPGGL